MQPNTKYTPWALLQEDDSEKLSQVKVFCRLKQLFRHHGITKIEYTWSMSNAEKTWCLGDDVVSALKKERIAEVIHPLSTTHKDGE